MVPAADCYVAVSIEMVSAAKCYVAVSKHPFSNTKSKDRNVPDLFLQIYHMSQRSPAQVFQADRGVREQVLRRNNQANAFQSDSILKIRILGLKLSF